MKVIESSDSFQREIDLLLRPLAAFETISFKLIIMADLGFTTSKEATTIEHKVTPPHKIYT